MYFFKSQLINPLAHEPSVTARANPRSFLTLVKSSVFMVKDKDNFVLMSRVQRSFKPYQNELNSVKDTREKAKKKMQHWPNFYLVDWPP